MMERIKGGNSELFPPFFCWNAWSAYFSLFCAHLSVPLAAPKVLSLDKKNKKISFYFVLCSLIRTFALAIGSPPHHDWVVWRRS